MEAGSGAHPLPRPCWPPTLPPPPCRGGGGAVATRVFCFPRFCFPSWELRLQEVCARRDEPTEETGRDTSPPSEAGGDLRAGREGMTGVLCAALCSRSTSPSRRRASEACDPKPTEKEGSDQSPSRRRAAGGEPRTLGMSAVKGRSSQGRKEDCGGVRARVATAPAPLWCRGRGGSGRSAGVGGGAGAAPCPLRRAPELRFPQRKCAAEVRRDQGGLLRSSSFPPSLIHGR